MNDPSRPGRDPSDDAIIGRAFRWSLLAFALVAGVALLGWLGWGRGGPPEAGPVEELQLAAPVERDLELPEVVFVDVTEASGIEFVHTNGARGDKLLPETMGAGAAFFDYDGDTDPDLLLVNSSEWSAAAAGEAPATLALYRNDGRGGFEDVTAEAGLGASFYGMGVAVADYDDDGDRDLFLTAVGPNRLLENRSGRFVDVTSRAGVAGGRDTWSTSAGFFDYDRDGDLDLFVCNYVRWSRQTDLELNFTLNGRDRAYGPPTDYGGDHSYLYRNDGGGTFTDVSEAVAVSSALSGDPTGKALAVTFADLDRDGWIDVVVANDTVQNFVFRNRGDGGFDEIGAVSGVGFDAAGNATGAMGGDVAHYRNDERLAIAIANFSNEMSSLYVELPFGLQFSDEAMGEGIGAASRLRLSFGLFFFDYDLDGRLDLLQANGHLESEIQQVQASQSYRQPAQLFWNAGPDRAAYVEVPSERLGDLARPIVGRASTYADVDGDGDLDVLLTDNGGRPLLLRNDQRLGHRWLRVELVGRDDSRDAIGAWVEIEAGGAVQRRQVMPTRSYLSQVELPITFGLGGAERVDALRVDWPDGSRETLAPPAPNRAVRVVQGEGAVSEIDRPVPSGR